MSRQNTERNGAVENERPRKFSLCAILCCAKTSARVTQPSNRRPVVGNQGPPHNRVQQRPNNQRRQSRSQRNGRAHDSESPSSQSEEEEQKQPNQQNQQNQPGAGPKETNLQLVTKFSEAEVGHVDMQPDVREERYKYKYYCPICLRYFTHMLQSACCQNYLCLLCTKDLQEREKKEQAFVANCPYKCTPVEGAGTKFKLSDVPPEAQIKRYSDSQCMSMFSNNLPAQQSNNAGGGGQVNGRGTLSSAGMSAAAGSGFKWSVHNKALGPAFVEDKENLVNQGSEEGSRNIGGAAFGVRSLIIGPRDKQTLSEYAASAQHPDKEGVGASTKPPMPLGSQFGMRSQGANGFNRNTLQGQLLYQKQQRQRGLTDLDVNSLTSAPHQNAQNAIDSRGFSLGRQDRPQFKAEVKSPPEVYETIQMAQPQQIDQNTSLEEDLKIMDQLSRLEDPIGGTPEVRYFKQDGGDQQSAQDKHDSPPIEQMFGAQPRQGNSMSGFYHRKQPPGIQPPNVGSYIDQNRFANSLPRTFSPSLSSIGAAGFMAKRGGQGSVASDYLNEEERQMGNTFGSNVEGVQPPLPLGMNYPFSDEEQSQDQRRGQVRLVGVQNYPEGRALFRTNEHPDESQNDPRDKPEMQMQELVDDTFAALNERHVNEDAKRSSNAMSKPENNMFGSQDAAKDEQNDSHLFPPISKRSANFNQDDMMRSLDPLDEIAGEINRDKEMAGASQTLNTLNNIQKPRPLFLSQGVTQQRKRRETGKAAVEHSIASESDDNISRAIE